MLTLLRNAELYSPESRGNCDLMIAGGRIVWIGDNAPAIPDPLEVSEVDLAGARVIPGLIDAHVHLTGGGGEAGPETRVPRLHLTELTRDGVTTVVGLLGTDGVTRTVRDLVATTYGLRAEGMNAWCYTGSYQVPPVTLTGSVRDDIVFIDPVVGVGELALSDHRSSQPTFDELARVAADAHTAGIMTGKAGIVHLHLGDGERRLELVRELLERTELPPSVFHPTHVNRNRPLFEEAKTLAARGVTVDVTAFEDATDGIDAAAAIEELYDAGVSPQRVTISSDAGGCIPTFDAQGRVSSMDVGRSRTLLATLARLVAGGMPLERALPPFTSSPADLFRWDSAGCIEQGAQADLVVLDVAGLATDVMIRGRWMVRNGRAVEQGIFERNQ